MSTTSQAHSTHRPRARQARETRDVQRYLRALFEREHAGALIELRYRYRAGMRQRFLPAADLFTAARTIVRLGINTDVYVGVAPRQQAAGDKTSITRVWTLRPSCSSTTAKRRAPYAPSPPRSPRTPRPPSLRRRRAAGHQRVRVRTRCAR
ncbi:MAG: hypothetical protein LC777_20615 [Actinobacteria bacterium]|nr:hypothetical protein [Actinomycetota bacterium]